MNTKQIRTRMTRYARYLVRRGVSLAERQRLLRAYLATVRQ